MTDEDVFHASRIIEAVIFASAQPVTDAELEGKVGSAALAARALALLSEKFSGGVVLRRAPEGWLLETRPELTDRLYSEIATPKALPALARKVLGYITLYQPLRPADLNRMLKRSVNGRTLRFLEGEGWIAKVNGRWVTTEALLSLVQVGALMDVGLLDEDDF